MSWSSRNPIVRHIIPPTEHELRYRELEDRPILLQARLLALATVLVGGLYLIWLASTVNREHPLMAAAFIGAEAMCLVLFLVASFAVWGLRYKPREGLPLANHGSVDIFVPTCGEPLEIIGPTLEAASRIQWQGRLTVYVLDDAASDSVRDLAHQHGFQYASRLREAASLDHAKAGNLNFGLSKSDGEFVLVLDADQVPQAYILRALAGYMQFQDVGFIQSRQFFTVPRGDPFFNLDRVFYEAVQLGFDNRSMALSCGSGVLYRRAALAENNGFTSWNVVEDLTTSYDLHSRGWRSFYYPHALSEGLAPSDIWGVCHQRSQWALDTMRLFFWDNPFFKRDLPRRARMSYMVLPLSYFCAGYVFPFFFVIPLWTYLTGNSVIADSELEFAVIRGTYFICMAFALRALFRRQEAGRQFQMLVGLFPVYVIGTIRALVYPPSRLSRYSPNNASHRAKRPAAIAVLPQLTVWLANAVLPFYAIAAGTAAPRLIVGNACISALAMWSLLPVIVAALTGHPWNEQPSSYAPTRVPARTDS